MSRQGKAGGKQKRSIPKTLRVDRETLPTKPTQPTDASSAETSQGRRQVDHVSRTVSILAFLVAAAAWAWPFFGWTTWGDSAAKEVSASNYFKAIQTLNTSINGVVSSGVGMALAHSSPGSPAEQHALAIQALWTAYPNARVVTNPTIIRYEGDSVEICIKESCSLIENLRYDEDRRLKDFTRDGLPVSQLTVQDQTEAQLVGPLEVNYLGGIRSTDGTEYRFAIEVRNQGDSVIEIDPTAIYRDPANETEETTVGGGLGEIAVAQPTRLYAVVKGSPGGWMSINISEDNGEIQNYWIKIP